MAAKGLKKQIFGGVLLGLGAITTLLSRIIGFELDVFYLVISAIGAGLILVGVLQMRSVP